MNEHQKQYQAERSYRWQMADTNEEKAIASITNFLNSKDGNNWNYLRLDHIIHSKYSPDSYDWSKGCPDYAIYKNSPSAGLVYVEIKLKTQQFRKTVEGGTTRQGSKIEKYGCPSFYLDIYPVYENMCKFCNEFEISPEKFIITFVPIDINVNEIRIITLNAVNKMIENGWQTKSNNSIKICKYGEGYGQETYLIPKDACQELATFNWQKVLEIKSESNEKLKNLIFEAIDKI